MTGAVQGLMKQGLCLTGAVQVGFINGDVVINPSRTDMRSSLLNLVVSASEHNKVGEFLVFVL